MNNRVVITGLGVVSPNGVGLDLSPMPSKKGSLELSTTKL